MIDQNINDPKLLDKIVKDTIESIEKGRQQIYDIAESARSEYERVAKEVEKLKAKVIEAIEQVERMDREERRGRVELMEVSRNFRKYAEEDVRRAYEMAKNAQVQLSLARERENNLRIKRDELELSLKNLEYMVEKAEGLISQIGVVLEYLGSNLQKISNQIEGEQQRKNFSMSIIRAQEEERKRVAREIHDGPAQDLANIVIRAEMCEKLLQIKPHEVEGELKELKWMVRESLKDLRKVIFDLRPMALDDLGIIPTLRRYISEFETRENMIVHMAFHGEERRFNSAIEVTAFRVIQEALNNVKKHAKADRAKLRLEITEEVLNISIVDNGKGFSVEEAMDGGGRSRFGLISMKERLDLLEGRFEIKSEPGKGAEIRASIPLKDEQVMTSEKD
ncbi:two-component system sensor histidine kinase DegS [Desulfitispora alkaliphila]|uniref:sensor histidine kinase n=1 Tax=Desulfitispora alkaliphila TaxID=622674 RepID=UPI003D1BC28A